MFANSAFSFRRISALASRKLLITLLIAAACHSASDAAAQPLGCEPRELAPISLPDLVDIRAVSTSGTLLAIGSSSETLLFDAAISAHPRLISTLATPTLVTSLELRPPLLVVTTAGGISVFDVACPESPTLLFTEATQHFAISVHLEGNLAYIAGQSLEYDPLRAGGVYVFDLSVPTSLRLLGKVSLAGIFDMAVANGFAYVSRFNQIAIIDFRSPTNPRMVGSVDWSDFEPRALAITESHLFAANFGRMKVLSRERPDQPEVIQELSIESTELIPELAVWQKRLLLISNDGSLEVFNIAVPSATSRLASLRLADSMPYSVAFVGTTAYVAGSLSGVSVLDMTSCQEKPALIPIVANAAGVDGKRYVSSLSLINRSSLPADVDLEFWDRASGTKYNARQTVAPLSTQTFENALAALFGAQGAGPLFLLLPPMLEATSRIVESSRGISIPVDRTTEELTPGKEFSVLDIAEDDVVRCNLAFANASREHREIDLRLRMLPSAELHQLHLILPPSSAYQITNIISSMGASTPGHGDLFIESDASGVTTYVSENRREGGWFLIRFPRQTGIIGSQPTSCRSQVDNADGSEE